MEFSREGQNIVKCVISENEIGDMGYSMDEILTNREKSQEFMNSIFQMAEQKFEMKFETGIKTVHADFRPDRTLVLTFSAHNKGNAMIEHLKDIITGIFESIPEAEFKAFEERLEEEIGHKLEKSPSPQEANKKRIVGMITFPSIEVAAAFAKHVDIPEIEWNGFFKYQGEYVLCIDVSTYAKEDMLRLSTLIDEYADCVKVGVNRKAFFLEHAEVLIGEKAIEQLRQL